MKKLLIAILLICLPTLAMAAASNYKMEPFRADLRDQESLQRGMALFVNRCMGCHSMEYQRFARTAQDLGIPEDLMEEYLILGDHAINDLMTIAMDKKRCSRLVRCSATRSNTGNSFTWKHVGLQLHAYFLP